MADMMNPKTRSAATDFSSVNKADFMGGVAPAQAHVYATREGDGTASGPATVIEGIYTHPEGGRAK